MTPLEPLTPVRIQAVELVSVSLPLARPLRSAAGERSHREVLLVHVLAGDVEGWAECATEPEPTYAPEFTATAALVLREHLVPQLWSSTGDALALQRALRPVRGHHEAKAALELAVLDAQLRTAGRSLAAWLGATERTVRAGAALGLPGDLDVLRAEADAAVVAGACRLRLKIAPGRAVEPLVALRDHVDPEVLLQADANGSFNLDDDRHLAELREIDELGLVCLEQPLATDDLLGHARLVGELETPICLDEPLTSLHAIEAAHALGACEVVCLKPARVGGWLEARRVHDRCAELGLPVWVGGMLETGVGRAANLAVAALPEMDLPADLDPRPRYEPDLAPPAVPDEGGLVTVPDEPGACPAPDATLLAAAHRVALRRTG